MKRLGLRLDSNIDSKPDIFKIEKYVEYLTKWIENTVKKANCEGVVVGISGGIDSALVAALAKRAFPNNTLGIVMPIDSMKFDLNDIEALSKNLNLELLTIDLKSTFDELNSKMNINDKMAISNIKPRLRMTTLYAIAQEKKYLVAGTDNEDELFIGYFTKHGDGGVDFLPISRLLKNEVKLLAKHLDVPESIINKKPSAGLWEGQSDENELGFTYNDLDNYLNNNLELVETNIKLKIERLHKNSQHKRDKAYKPKSIEQYFKNKKGDK
ncbi:NH(3)-dependent NAD(+) synthetase [Mycoplasmopsis bovigenitalium 51080]|uniref:NH(3)-dependent NAD(+) synthetase n=1 Tax=Mycoplasmopsis bovigenitalium 51080 TaxID=1188235 RepID=N9VDK7_9BACT|nr:NAD(+) synthase [Mycoplasmopsis bovigenitalium]ENY69718.1 NH(3)-dependent NAD(+) synthetase [Mycoplasmopsis bovigenitalium 51080]